MSAIKRRRILDVVATDSTFELRVYRGERVWVGKCIHCNRRLLVAADGAPISNATIEHIQPRNHGGTDHIENLALACGPCNFEKGRRHDVRRRGDPRLDDIVGRLQQIRRERWREPGS
jgi:5-methylcytosine-specific restriction endonuclease McrA